WRGVRGVWPALLVSGGTFALVQFLVSNLFGPSLVDVLGGLASLGSLALLLRFWQPRERWHFADEPAPPTAAAAPRYTSKQVLAAWVPWMLLTVLVFVWGVPQVKKPLTAATSPRIPVPGAHDSIKRGAAVSESDKPEEAVYRFD